MNRFGVISSAASAVVVCVSMCSAQTPSFGSGETRASAVSELLVLNELVVGQHGHPGRSTHAASGVRHEFPGTEYVSAPILLRSFHFIAPERSAWIRARSCFFDPYLVVRDATGLVIAEDDNAGLRWNARIAMSDLCVGETYQIDVCAWPSSTGGAFDVVWYTGSPESEEPTARLAGELAEARRSVVVVQDALGEGHRETMLARFRLAGVFIEQHELVEARKVYEQSLAAHRRAEGAEGDLATRCLIQLAAFCYQQRDFRSAALYFEELLPLLEERLGVHHPSLATVRGQLAHACVQLGRIDEAVRHYRHAIRLGEGESEINSGETEALVRGLACVLHGNQDYQEALPLYERIVRMRRESVGSIHPSTAMALSDLAGTYVRVAELEKAECSYEEALAILEMTAGRSHRTTACVLNNFAKLLALRGELARAQVLAGRAVAAFESKVGREHPDTTIPLNTQADVLEAAGSFDDARRSRERIVKICKDSFGLKDRRTAAALDRLGVVLTHLGEYQRAREVTDRGFAMRSMLAGPEHPETALSLHHLGVIALRDGDHVTARVFLERALKIQECALGKRHPAYAESLRWLLRCLDEMGDHESAAAYRRASAAANEVR